MPSLLKNRIFNWFLYRIKRSKYEKTYKEYWINRGHRFVSEWADSPVHNARVAVTTDYISKLNPKTILEYGVGFGVNLKALHEKLPNSQLYGVDIGKDQLESARKFTNEKATLQQIKDEKIPYDDKFFDVSFTSSVLQHIPPADFEKICNELIRVTKNYIIHGEHNTTYSHKYKHDYKKFYESGGYSISFFQKPEIDPSQFWFIISLNRTN